MFIRNINTFYKEIGKFSKNKENKTTSPRYVFTLFNGKLNVFGQKRSQIRTQDTRNTQKTH